MITAQKPLIPAALVISLPWERKQRLDRMVRPVLPKISHTFESNKAKRNGLIHIQARDEVMIFKDNTDLVSHITTPSAVRTLVFDHEEFAEVDVITTLLLVSFLYYIPLSLFNYQQCLIYLKASVYYNLPSIHFRRRT